MRFRSTRACIKKVDRKRESGNRIVNFTSDSFLDVYRPLCIYDECTDDTGTSYRARIREERTNPLKAVRAKDRDNIGRIHIHTLIDNTS